MAGQSSGMRVVLAAVLICLGLQARAEVCRQALVLALDVSGSVDIREYRQQVAGLSAALDAAEVRDLILMSGAPPVALAVFEWSSQNHQLLIQPWVLLRDEATLDQAIARIRNHRKQRAGLKTALGTALGYAGALLDAGPACWRRTIDVSGDGENNIGPTPMQTYGRPSLAGVTVNALVIGDLPLSNPTARIESRTAAHLVDYFEREVIRGPDAFAMSTEGYQDYQRAMQRKLLRELSVPELARAAAPGE